MTQEALKLALEALEVAKQHIWLGDKAGVEANIKAHQTIIFIKEALAQPEQDWVERERAVGYREGHQNALQALHDENERLGLYKDAYAEKSMKVEGPLHVVCQCDKCKAQLDIPAVERAWFTIDELNAWADKKLAENPDWVMPTEEPERKEALAQPEQEPVADAYTFAEMRFVVCHNCGNKRCPKANDHRNACTNSNEVGQKGSSWKHVKPLAQPEQETVSTDWERIARVQNAKLMAMCNEAGGFEKLCEVMDKYEKTPPPQRTWVGLDHHDKKEFSSWLDHKTDDEVFTAIEAKLKQKNGYAEEKNT